MTGAIEAVQRVLAETLRQNDAVMAKITGLFDGPPARQPFPYIAIAGGMSQDWSHKTGTGRALSLAIRVHDDGRTARRLQQIMTAVEAALADGLDSPDDWQIVTFRFHRSRLIRSADRPWTGLVEYRARVLKK